MDFKFRALAPPADSTCTTGPAPLPCCTGAGTGFCQTSDNAACTDVLTPYPCCTGAGEGFCGVSNSDCTGVFTPAACCFGAGIGVCNTGKGSDASCTTGPAPHTCCTGAGTGSCQPEDNAACTARFVPSPCCTGAGRGTCGDIFQLARYAIGVCDNEALVSSQTQSADIPMCVVQNQPPFIGYQIKDQGVKIQTGGSISIPALGIVNAPVPAMESLTAKRVLLPAKPGDVKGEHLLAFSDFLLPALGNPKPTATVVTAEFPTITDTLGARSFVIINAVKDLQAQPPVPPLTSVWACYGFENPLGGKVSWEDQFGPATGTLRGSKRLCFPASLLGTVPPATTYLCVRNDADKLGPLFKRTCSSAAPG